MKPKQKRSSNTWSAGLCFFPTAEAKTDADGEDGEKEEWSDNNEIEKNDPDETI